MADILLERYSEFFYHKVPSSSIAAAHMEMLRIRYLQLAQSVLDLCPPTETRHLSLLRLQESLMRAIQSLALTGELVDPRHEDE